MPTDYGKIFENITTLQKLEQTLLDQLNATGTSLSPDQRNIIISQINDLSDARIGYFSTINAVLNSQKDDIAGSASTLVSQLTLAKSIDDQLSNAKQQYDNMKNNNDTKLRLVEINTYYGQRYESHSNLMKTLIYVCVPLLLLFILKNKSLLPETLANYLIGITIAVGTVYVGRELWDNFTRSSMNYDEYDWKYEDPNAYVPTVWQYNKEHLLNIENPLKTLVKNLGICVGEDCCAPGMYFNKEKQKCMGAGKAGAGTIIQGKENFEPYSPHASTQHTYV
jgi:hypothetical protein